MESNKVYYFGCKGETGHYLFASDGGYSLSSYGMEKFLPFKVALLDTMLLDPKAGKAPQFSIVNGWSIVGCWDNTVDKRPGSNSSFLVEGVHTMEETLAIAKKHFPITYKRVYGE